MCGIAAIISKKIISGHHIKQMSDLVRHRGPDDEGFALFSPSKEPLSAWGEDTAPGIFDTAYPYSPASGNRIDSLSAHVLLGHRRLSILDLSPSGHQPMCSSDQRFWISYNGEVFNYLEIKEELSQKGHVFLTSTDTEVILHAYEEWGRECLHHFNGMFAFVLYDTQTQTLFAARDRFGVKPLYYWRSHFGFLALASEIKQFTLLPGWRAVVNTDPASTYLSSGITDHSETTLFKDVFQVRGGEFLLYDHAEQTPAVKIQRWYHLPEGKFHGSEQEASKQFRELLEDAVRLRLRADVDVGFCLSGGLDSSTIVCLANRILAEKGASYLQKTFSSCSLEKEFDERHHVETVTRFCNPTAQFTYPELESLFEIAPKIVWHQDEPFGSTSIYAQWKVFQLAKEHGVKVVLDGQGADEQLAGYPGFFQHHLYDLLLSGKWTTLLNEALEAHRNHKVVLPIAKKLMHRLTKTIFSPWQNNSNLQWSTLPMQPPLSVVDKNKYGHVNAETRRLLLNHSLPMLLRYEDRDSMAHSIESRTPFIDYRLVEFTASLPSHYKISRGVTKRVLREGMKGILPESIRMRMDKLGFATACEVWVKKHQPALFLKKVNQAVEQSKGLLTPHAVNLTKEIIEGRQPYSFLVWRMINFGMWMDAFSVHPD